MSETGNDISYHFSMILTIFRISGYFDLIPSIPVRKSTRKHNLK